MEKEEAKVKCLSSFPRQGKKYLLILIAVNALIVWYYYGKTNASCLNPHLSYGTIKTSAIQIQNMSLFHIPLLNAKDMAPFYIEININTWCFQHGINLLESKKHKKCICSNHWFGLDCGIPEVLWKSQFMQEGKNAGVEIRRREKPRRIIYSIIIANEYDLLEIIVSNTNSFVDLFLIIQENGLNVSLTRMFDQGYLSQHQHKIMPFLHNRSESYRIKGNYKSLLNKTWEVAWKKLTDFRPDDLIMFSHASSILSENVLLFLKLYDGYPERFTFKLRPLMFNFSQEVIENNINSRLVPFTPSGCSFQFLSGVCKYEIKNYFDNTCLPRKQYVKTVGKKRWKLYESTIGSTVAPSGWQFILLCKSCNSGKNSFQNWLFNNISASSFVEKSSNQSVIENVLKNKTSLVNNLKFKIVTKDDFYFAPSIIFNSLKKYSYLIE